MSTNRGIFEGFLNQPATRPDSPVEVFGEPVALASAASPFTAAARVESPFTVVEKGSIPRPVESGRPAQLPERRKPASPFQIARHVKEFGLDAAGHIEPPLRQAVASALAVEPQRGPSASTQAALPQAFAQSTPMAFEPAPVPATFAPVPQEAYAVNQSNSDSFAIRQLELRAIFGVDRELNSDEILQRSRALPGIRHVARVSPEDMATLESLKQVLPHLGFGSGSLKLHTDSGPLEFIREGIVMLAVQADGGFTPGVRETLMLVARELDRLS